MCGSCLLFKWLGDEYFSWWYVQRVLPFGTGIISLYAFIVFLICDCFCPFFFIKKFNLLLKHQTVNVQWYEQLLTLFAIFLREQARRDSLSEYVYIVLLLYNVHVLHCIELVI